MIGHACPVCGERLLLPIKTCPGCWHIYQRRVWAEEAAMSATFNGTEAEARLLKDAVDRNCDCRVEGVQTINGYRTVNRVCAMHTALVDDQQLLDRLLFERRDRERLKREEHMPKGTDPCE